MTLSVGYKPSVPASASPYRLFDEEGEIAWANSFLDAQRIRLTGKGTSTWAGMQEPIEAFYSSALSTFSHEDQIALYRLLDRLKTALTKV